MSSILVFISRLSGVTLNNKSQREKPSRRPVSPWEEVEVEEQEEREVEREVEQGSHTPCGPARSPRCSRPYGSVPQLGD